MTRESKIGLLVGLGFVIVIGILLSEHVAEQTDAPAARLAEAGPAVRLGSAVPAVIAAAPVFEGRPTMEPSEVVPTQAELRGDFRRERPIVALAATSTVRAERVPSNLPVIGPSSLAGGGGVSVQMDAPAQTASANLYTVQAGDSLWRIAQVQAGNPSAVAAIKDLNRDVLRGSDVVRPGMTLRLP